MNGIELFNKLYNEEISNENCIKVTNSKEESFYLLRDSKKEFDKKELINSLLYKEYVFEIVNQTDVENMLKEKEKQNRIKQLEEELEKLKGG